MPDFFSVRDTANRVRPASDSERLRLQVWMLKFAGIPSAIAERMLGTARKTLGEWDADGFILRELPEEHGPGMALLLEARYENVTEVVSGFGKLGQKAERIGKSTASRIAGYEKSMAFAGPYLQDQLLLPFAIAEGGSFSTVKISQHTRTAAEIIERFTDRKVTFETSADGTNIVRIS